MDCVGCTPYWATCKFLWAPEPKNDDQGAWAPRSRTSPDDTSIITKGTGSASKDAKGETGWNQETGSQKVGRGPYLVPDAGGG